MESFSKPFSKPFALYPDDDPRNEHALLIYFIKREGLERKLEEFRLQILLDREAKNQADAIEKQRKIQEDLELSSTSKLIKIANQKCIFTLAEKQEISKLSRNNHGFKKLQRLKEINSQRQERFDKVGGDKSKNEREYYFKIIAFNFDVYID
jgi:hypothetical protein